MSSQKNEETNNQQNNNGIPIENINEIKNEINYDNSNINQDFDSDLLKAIEESNKTNIPNEKTNLNPDYYDEFGRPKYEDVVKFENELRAEIELNSPLVSDTIDIEFLIGEFKDSQFENSVKEIIKKYKSIRTIRRDGNCFYRAFMFRLFEELSQKKDAKLYKDVVKVVEESKLLCEKNGYQWMVFEDFYNMFISEWKFVYQLDPLNAAEYM